MNVLDLFSGIGGFSLGLERAGMRTVAFCEIEPFCRRVLARHWPNVPCYDDIRTLTADRLRADGVSVDVICGGFPCQDISLAGKGAGIDGDRSSLWRDYARIIGELRPRYVIVENVSALLGRGLDRVLGDLAALGFDAEWHCIPASAIGAPHRRDRLWIIADARSSGRWPAPAGHGLSPKSAELQSPNRQACPNNNPSICADVADAIDARSSRARGKSQHQGQIIELGDGHPEKGWSNAPDTDSQPTQRFAIAWSECGQWLSEPDVGRVANGVPARVDRLKGLGNAVVPQIPEIIGRAILNRHNG